MAKHESGKGERDRSDNKQRPEIGPDHWQVSSFEKDVPEGSDNIANRIQQIGPL